MKRVVMSSFILFLVLSGCVKKYSPTIQEYLRPGIYIDSDHAEIVEKVRELVGDERDEVKRAKILFEFVRDEISEKYYEESFKASEILRVEYGVCHQKAVLLTALCRAAGIPARITFNEVHIHGYVHSEKGRLDVHKFIHGITEMYLGGRWIKYDQTGNIKRWKIWVQDDPVEISLPLVFRTDRDVVFPSVGRIVVKETGFHLFDWDEEKVQSFREALFSSP